MDQLPLEILEKILKLLSKNDLQNCKTINRRWYSTINQFKYERLAITDTWIFKTFWFYDYTPVDYNDKIKIKSFDTFKFNLNDQFKKIKYLFLHSDGENSNKICKISNLINNLLELENLNLTGLSIENNDCINLISLKTLSYKSSGKLIFNTPNLENLRIGYYSTGLEIKFPKKIKYLYVAKMYSSYIEEFSNLEYFYVEHVYTAFFTILKELPNLKQLHFESSSSWNTFEIIYEQKQNLKRTEFEPFMFGINFKNIDNKDYDPYCAQKSNFILYKEYFNNLANNLKFIRSFNYNDFEDVDFGHNTLNMIKKFVCIKELKITRNVNNVNLLIQVLKCLANLIRDLIIESSNLDQIEFLPKIVPILNLLTIKNEKNIDFNFLTKFESVKIIEIDQNLSNKIRYELISKLNKTFELISFIEDNKVGVKLSKNKVTGEINTFKRQFKLNAKSLDNLNLNYLFDSDSSEEDFEMGTLFD